MVELVTVVIGPTSEQGDALTEPFGGALDRKYFAPYFRAHSFDFVEDSELGDDSFTNDPLQGPRSEGSKKPIYDLLLTRLQEIPKP